MKAFWIQTGRLGILALAVVGALTLVGVDPVWAGIGGFLLWDLLVIVTLSRPGPGPRAPRRRSLARLELLQPFLN